MTTATPKEDKGSIPSNGDGNKTLRHSKNTEVDDRPDFHKKDLEGFVVSDHEEESDSNEEEDEETEYSDEEEEKEGLEFSDEEDEHVEPLVRTHAINHYLRQVRFASMNDRWASDRYL